MMIDNLFARLDESTKNGIDAGALVITVSAFLQLLPSITSLATLVWVLLRIWETETVKRWTGRWDGNKSEGD